ncbi:hypothetical protein DERP_006279 [Dermatophagoides pteronyssinus]|uniref:Transmembrane protein n=1 Tax=Dermatophagoides pteronyssinus TaxID=6956 RepID=A0ABQ8IXZ0_DERPT|nr:hypothetical protein DERP_006279 [Dermatophagoides pteronyssinus]
MNLKLKYRSESKEAKLMIRVKKDDDDDNHYDYDRCFVLSSSIRFNLLSVDLCCASIVFLLAI